MKNNKLLAAGILTLGLTSCITLSACSQSLINSTTTTASSITSTSNISSMLPNPTIDSIQPTTSIVTSVPTSSNTSSITPSTSTPAVNEFVSKTTKAISYTPYETEFTITPSEAANEIKIKNNVYTIQYAGTYTLSGNLEDGRIEVKKELGEVTLILDNVSVSGIDAAIWIKKSNNVTITAKEGSVNYFKDGSAESFESTFISEEDDEPKGTIFSKSPITINGTGSIYIISSATNIPYTESNETSLESINGIHVKDNLTIDGAFIYIDSVNDGIKNKGTLDISNSTIEIKAGDDGIASDYDEDVLEDNKTGVITLTNNNIIISSTHDGIQAEYGVISTSGEYYITAGTNGSDGVTDDDSHKGIKASFDDTTEITLISTIEISGGIYYLDCLDDAVHSDDNITLTGGTFVIKTKDDGVHADSDLVIEGEGPSITILKSYEGLEGLDITIDSGFIYIVSEDDGINAAGGNDNTTTPGSRPGGNWGWGGGPNSGTTDGAVITITGGTIIVNASGDGIDSNGNVYIKGGNTIVNANVSGDNTALDFDGSCQITGGLFIAAGSSGMLEYPSSSSQKVLCTKSNSRFDSNTYYGIFDSSNNLIAAFKSTYATSSLFFSSSDLLSSGTYTVKGGGTYTGGTDFYGYSTGGTYTGGTTLTINNSGR